MNMKSNEKLSSKISKSFFKTYCRIKLLPRLLYKAIANPKYIELCIWAFGQLWWVNSRLESLASEALSLDSKTDLPLTPNLKKDIELRAKAIFWTAKIHPVRPKCLHRSLVLYKWLKQQEIDPQLEIGWQGKVAHAWVSYQGQVLNDRSDVAEVTPRLTRVTAKNSV